MILLIVLTALLVLVWLPWIIVSIRKVMRETSGRPASSCHPEPDPLCHPELVEGSGHPEPTLCHPEPAEGSRHPGLDPGSPIEQ